MKRIAITVLLLLCCMCAPANAANFVEIVRDDLVLIYIDADSIELRKTNNSVYVVAWVKWIYRGEYAKAMSDIVKQPVESIMHFTAFNKDHLQSQTLSLHVYGMEGRFIDSTSYTFKVSEYEEIVPGTKMRAVHDFVMYYYNRNK